MAQVSCFLRTQSMFEQYEKKQENRPEPTFMPENVCQSLAMQHGIPESGPEYGTVPSKLAMRLKNAEPSLQQIELHCPSSNNHERNATVSASAGSKPKGHDDNAQTSKNEADISAKVLLFTKSLSDMRTISTKHSSQPNPSMTGLPPNPAPPLKPTTKSSSRDSIDLSPNGI